LGEKLMVRLGRQIVGLAHHWIKESSESNHPERATSGSEERVEGLVFSGNKYRGYTQGVPYG